MRVPHFRRLIARSSAEWRPGAPDSWLRGSTFGSASPGHRSLEPDQELGVDIFRASEADEVGEALGRARALLKASGLDGCLRERQAQDQALGHDLHIADSRPLSRG